MKNTAANIYVSRVVAAVASLIASLLVVEQNPAGAAGTCDTAAPVNNAAVDCFGGTITANDPNGWGTGTETGDTITVESDAALHGNNAGIFVKDATIINRGSIAGASFGIFFNSTSIVSSVTNGANQISGLANAINAAGDLTVSNGSGKIFSNGAGGIAIVAGGTATIDNAQGQINGDVAAIIANAINIKSNEGVIQAFGTPDALQPVVAVRAIAGDVTVHNGKGVIQAIQPGTIAIQSITGAVTIETNDNLIAGGLAGISAASVFVNSNNGSIIARDVGSSAISASAVTVQNNGLISGGGFGIDATAVTVQSNSGTIEARDAAGHAINADTNATVTNGDTIQALGAGGIAIFAGGKATVTNGDDKGAKATISGDAFGIQAVTLAVTNFAGATISSANGIGIEGSGDVVNAGTISGATKSVNFTGGAGATNTLTLKDNAVLIGDAVGSAGATNNLILRGGGIANNNFQNFNSLTFSSGKGWILNGQSTVGTATVDNLSILRIGDENHPGAVLTGNVMLNTGGTLAGQGKIEGDINVDRGDLTPGNPTGTGNTHSGTMNVTGNVRFTASSNFIVSTTPTETTKLAVGGTATLGGAQVFVESGGTNYAPSTKYTILTATGIPGVSPGVIGKFANKILNNLPFLSPSLTYDDNDVFLTLDVVGAQPGTPAGTVFGNAAQTRNQIAVAGALDAAVLGATPVSNPMLLALLNLTSAVGARQAFDALSGEVFGSVQNTQATHMRFTREAMLGRMRQASYSYEAPYGLGALSFGGPELAYAGGEADANAMAAFPAKSAVASAKPLARFDLLGTGPWRLGSCR